MANDRCRQSNWTPSPNFSAGKSKSGRKMASVTRLKNGLKAVEFYNGDGKRLRIRLGKATKADASLIATKIQELNGAKINGHSLSTETASWLSSRPDTLYAKLVR